MATRANKPRRGVTISTGVVVYHDQRLGLLTCLVGNSTEPEILDDHLMAPHKFLHGGNKILIEMERNTVTKIEPV